MMTRFSRGLILGGLSVLCLTGCGAVTTTTTTTHPLPSTVSPTNVMSELTLRQQLEELEAKARASVQEVTPDTFLSFVEQSDTNPESLARFRSRWIEPEAKNALQNFVLPDLSQQKFLEVKQEGDWAGYYYLSDLDQADRLTINVMRFHNVSNTWKVTTQSGVSSIEAGTTETENQALIQAAMKESDALLLVPKL